MSQNSYSTTLETTKMLAFCLVFLFALCLFFAWLGLFGLLGLGWGGEKSDHPSSV